MLFTFDLPMVVTSYFLILFSTPYMFLEMGVVLKKVQKLNVNITSKYKIKALLQNSSKFNVKYNTL